MQRRSFLTSILVGATAPAFVRSESLMKLWIPREKILLTPSLITREAMEILAENYRRNNSFTARMIPQMYHTDFDVKTLSIKPRIPEATA